MLSSRIQAFAFGLLLSISTASGLANAQKPEHNDSKCASDSVPTSQVNSTPDALALFVSPMGNDTWSGRLASPNPTNTDGPLATIEEARNRIREIKSTQGGLKRPVTVLLRGGVYSHVNEIVFTTADSGTKTYPITYQNYPGECAIVSGGKVVRG